MARPVFKSDLQKQPSLFPISFEGFVPEKHPVRLVNAILDRIDLTELLLTYKGGGTSSYHPRTLLKILIYSYLNNVYSSRKIEKAAKENVLYIWLSGQSFPDHGTINSFRGSKLKGRIDDIFTQVVTMLHEGNIVSLSEVFTDGTKLESAANRYTFVWRGSVEKNKERLEKKIQVVLKEIERAIREDDSDDAQAPVEVSTSVSSTELGAKIEELNQRLKQVQAPKRTLKKVEKLGTEALPKLQEYEGHLTRMGERNSYAKTDPDATFMRMKEDHMRNGQLKPAYNLQLSTEHNFITNYSVHQRPGDTATFKEHMASYHQRYGRYPDLAVTDAGYGSLENYEYLAQHGIESYVKYSYFHKEQSKKFRHDISRVENLYYNAQQDFYVCPMGQRMLPAGKGKRASELGHEYEVTIYQAASCKGCPLNGACHKQKGNRRIEVNRKLVAYKQQSKENLLSEKGVELRGRRCTEVEQTFGQLKWNKKFNRFLLRGLPKVSIEIGILAIAHNLQKLATLITSDSTSAMTSKNWLFVRQLVKSILWLLFKKCSGVNKTESLAEIILSNYSMKKAA